MKNDNIYKPLFFSIFIVFVAVLYILTIREGHDWGDDFSMYINHAKNIVEGKSYGDTGYIYNKYRSVVGPKTYPPIYPILLAPIYYVFGLNLTVFKIEIIIFFMLSLFILFISFRYELKCLYLASLIAIIGFNPYFWKFKDNVLSDIPFLFFTYASLYLISRFYNSKNLSRQLINGIVVGTTIAISYGTKTIGFVLIPSIIVYELVKFRRPTQFLITTTVTFIFYAILSMIFLHNGSSYFDQIGLSPHYIAHYIVANALGYIRALALIWYSGKSLNSILLLWVLFIVVSFLSIVGYIKK